MQHNEYDNLTKRIQSKPDEGIEGCQRRGNYDAHIKVGNLKLLPTMEKDEIIERDIKASLEEVKKHLEGKIELLNGRNIEMQ